MLAVHTVTNKHMGKKRSKRSLVYETTMAISWSNLGVRIVDKVRGSLTGNNPQFSFSFLSC